MISRRFRSKRDGTVIMNLDEAERSFVGDAVEMLRHLGPADDDPATRRINVPAYLGDDEANDDWSLVQGSELDHARATDRDFVTGVLASEGPVQLSEAEALVVLRVVNEARLALGARLGIEVAEDYESLGTANAMAMQILGLFLEEIIEALNRHLD